MGSKWRKVKIALGLNLCVYVPRAIDDSQSSLNPAARFSDAYSPSDISSTGDSPSYRPPTPTSSSSNQRVSKSGPKSPKVSIFPIKLLHIQKMKL